MNQPNEKEITDFYSNLSEIWPKEDKWHSYTKRQIESFIQKNININNNIDVAVILNAGSGGNSYGINESKMIHLDITEKNIHSKNNYYVGSIEQVPLASNSIDIIICVGSVLNYTTATKAISELSRILKNQGLIILEFEVTETLEYFGTNDFGKSIAINETFYNQKPISIYMFSIEYINNLLKNANIKVIRKEKFHIISPFVLRLTKRPNLSSKFTFFDPLMRLIPMKFRPCSNIILAGKKVL